jgi:hypothetical protein
MANLCYKIIDINKKGEIKTLFHGIRGSKILSTGTWIEAVVKPVVDEGPNAKIYMSGFHLFKTKKAAAVYLRDQFRTKNIIRKNNKVVKIRKVIPVYAELFWTKRHSYAPILLARHIYVPPLK